MEYYHNQLQLLLIEYFFDLLPYIDGEGDVAAECRRLEALIQQHPIDVAFIGIGENGHLAFNDPPVADFHDPAQVKVVELAHACLRPRLGLVPVPVVALYQTGFWPNRLSSMIRGIDTAEVLQRFGPWRHEEGLRI